MIFILAGTLDSRMVTDVQFVAIVKLAEFLDAEALLDHLCDILATNFRELITMRTSPPRTCRTG